MIAAAFTALTLASAPVTPGCGPGVAPAPVTAAAPAAMAAPEPLPTTPLPAAPPSAAQPADDDEDQVTDLVVTARATAPPGDPLMALNAQSFEITQSVDKALVAPAARAYAHGLPDPVRKGLHNALSNLGEPDIAINFLLQGKPGRALVALARFAINSTVGVFGLVDVAKRKPFRLKHVHNSFADTLGIYGVKPGPFFYLPLIGPTTLRDVLGNAVDRLLLPVAVGRPFNRPAYGVSVGLVSALDYRTRFDAQLQKIRATDDPYTAAREYYLWRRQAEIDGLRGRVTPPPPIVVVPVSGSSVPSAPNQPAPSSLSRPPC